MSMVSLLADARHTAYIKDRWVYTDSGWEQMYQIVAPTLPGNGDYTAYNLTSKLSGDRNQAVLLICFIRCQL